MAISIIDTRGVQASDYSNWAVKRVPDAIKKLSESIDWKAVSFRNLRNMVSSDKMQYALMREGFREANPQTAFGLLMLQGVEVIANDLYIRAETAWQNYCLEVPSKARQEYHEPLFLMELPEEVPNGGRYPESRLVSTPREVVNRTFGRIEAFDRVLVDDDQSGQIRERAGKMGTSMATFEDIYVALRFMGTAGTYNNVRVPASTYATIDTNGNPVASVFSTAVGNTVKTSGGAYQTLSPQSVKSAWAAFLNMKDPLSNKLLINPNVLLVSSQDDVNANMIVNSENWASVQGTVMGAGPQTFNTANAGTLGTIGTVNPWKGRFKVVTARFLNDWAWSLMNGPSPAFLLQRRDAVEVVPELVATGQEFDSDARRFKIRTRFEVEWIEARYAVLGNPGFQNGAAVTIDGTAGVQGSN